MSHIPNPLSIFYNYVLLDTTRPGVFDYGRGLVFKFEPFYVGKGKGKRHISHFQPASLKADNAKNKRIRRIKRHTGEWPVAVIKRHEVDECTAFNCEDKLINLIGRKDLKLGPLLNRCAGGAGTSGRIDSLEVVQRRSASFKAACLLLDATAKKYWHANISAAHQSKTDEEREVFYAKCVASNRSHEDATRAKMSRSGAARVAAEATKQRKSRALKLSTSVQAYWDNADPAELASRSAAQAAAHAGMTESAKRSRNSKIAASTIAAHERMSDADRAAKADRIRQSILNRSPADKQKQAAGNSMRAAFKRHGIDLNHKVLRPKCDALRDRTAWDGREVTRTKFLAHVERILYPHY